MSLRAWVYRWARANGRDPAGTYEAARAALARHVDRDSRPGGTVGPAVVDALRAELGPEIVPYPSAGAP